MVETDVPTNEEKMFVEIFDASFDHLVIKLGRNLALFHRAIGAEPQRTNSVMHTAIIEALTSLIVDAVADAEGQLGYAKEFGEHLVFCIGQRQANLATKKKPNVPDVGRA